MAQLFEEASIRSMVMKNRLIKSATSENMAELDGKPTDETVRFYERLAKGGVGLVITGLAYVNTDGQVFPRQSGIHSDETIPAWKKVIEAVHRHGAKIAIQLAHSGRQVDPKMFKDRKPISPSASFNLAYLSFSRAMHPDEIEKTIEDFGKSASRAKEAGFDAVQIHAAHGYLISQFLSPLINRRKDKWGGDFERRFRFLEEVYKAVRRAVGDDFPVLCKLNVADFAIGGINERQSMEIAKKLSALGVDALEMSGGTTAESPLDMCKGDAPLDILRREYSAPLVICMKAYFALQRGRTRFREAYWLPYVEKLKPMIDKPVILLGGIRRRSHAEEVIREGKADFISMARPLIREPDLVEKWRKGEQESATCVSCNRCLLELSVLSKLKCYNRGR